MADTDERPAVWAGHIVINATDIKESSAFYVSLGMREVETNDGISVLELRGGTHLAVVEGDPAASASFDLMVDDVDATHTTWTSMGLSPSAIQRGQIHDSFEILDPAGTTVKINSSHVVGVV